MDMKIENIRRTKIVCTLGPATDNPDTLRELFLGGMNTGRLNLSHGTHEEHRSRIESFNSVRDKTGITASLMLDTKGPEIRIKTFRDNSITLYEGDDFILTTEEVEGDRQRVSITYSGFASDISKGDTLLLDDGALELKVLSTTETEVTTRVVTGGVISNSKKINVPDGRIRLPYINDADRADLRFAAENNIDFVAASFARSGEDIRELRETLNSYGGGEINIISKIENREGVDNIDEIIDISDGIMVARGDMGVEIPFEELPAIQKMIIRKTLEEGKPVITATQMLDSMIRNPRPTRAEITDVANAIYDGTSAIMLSGETSVGRYPVQALNTMTKIAIETEKHIKSSVRTRRADTDKREDITGAISRSTCLAAETLGASVIIAVTRSGSSARMVSRFRPGCPIIASTISDKTARQLTISWGTIPIVIDTGKTTDEIFDLAVKRSLEMGLINKGSLIVLTGGTPSGRSGTTDTMKVIRL